MALPNVTGEIIAQGYNCQVRVGTNPMDAVPIALVASFQIAEDFEVQDSRCINHHGPISIDSMGYRCTATLDGFLPSKRTLNGQPPYAGGGDIAIMDLVPARAQFKDGRQPKIAYMDFFNKKGAILATLRCVMITSNGIGVEGNSYVRNNVQMMALEQNAKKFYTVKFPKK